MEFATQIQTGPSRWTTDDVEVIAPTTPELQHSPRKWPLHVALFVMAIVSVMIGMKWWEARRKRKLTDLRVARWDRRMAGVPVDDERPLEISIPYWRQKRWEAELERREELKQQAIREAQEAEEAEDRRRRPRFISKAPWAQTKEDKEYLAWKAEKERQKKEKEALETAQTNAQLNAQRSLEIIRQATPIKSTMQERVPIVQIVSPRPTTDVTVIQPTSEKTDGEEEPPLVRIASRTRPPPVKSALRKTTSRKRPVIDIDADADDAEDRHTKKQKPNTPEAEVDAVTPTTPETPETADEETYEEPQMPGAFEVAPPKPKPKPKLKPKPAPQPAQQASRKRPASDDLEQDKVSQRKRTKHGKVASTAPAAQEEVITVDAWLIPSELMVLVPPRGIKRARSDVGSEFGDRLRVKKKGKVMKEITDVETGDQDKTQPQSQQLIVFTGSRKSKRASVANGAKKPVLEDEDEDVVASIDPLCQGRRIGSEWEVRNHKFKVGPDGKRLRLVPLRTRRKKYQMPIDSVHPDATAMIDVLIDTWLTEEEYKLARKQGNLGWQIITPNAPGHKTSSRRSSMSVCEEEQLLGKENKLPFPSCSPNEPGSGGDPPGKALMWTSGRIRGVSNTSLSTSPTLVMGSMPTTPGRPNRLSLPTTTKPTTPGRQTAVSLSSRGGNATTPARNGGTVITVRQLTTTPGGGMPSWSGMQKGRSSWARPAGANGMPGRHMLSMIEKREAEARALERLKARVTDLKAAPVSSNASAESTGVFSTAAPTILPAITVTSTEPIKPSTSNVTPTTTSLFAPPPALEAGAPRPSMGLFSNPPGTAPSTAAATATGAPSSSLTLAPPPSLFAASSILAPTTAPTLAPAIRITGETPSATTTTAGAPSLLSRLGATPAAPVAPAAAEKKERVIEPPLFNGLTGFRAPTSAPPPSLPTLNFGAPTMITTTAPPPVPTPTFNPTPAPAPTSQPQPPRPTLSFPMMGFNAQQPAAVPPAMERKEREPSKVSSPFGAFPTPTFPNTTTIAPATSAVNPSGPFANFGKAGATAAVSTPNITTFTVPKGGMLFGHFKPPQAPGITAAPTTGSLLARTPAWAEAAKRGAFSGAFNDAPTMSSTGFNGFSGFNAPKPAPEPEKETRPSQISQPPAYESLFSRLTPSSSQPTPSGLFGAPPAAPVPVLAPAPAPATAAQPPKPVFPGISLPLPKPAPSFSTEGPFGKHVFAYNTHNNSSVPTPASGGSLFPKPTPPAGYGKDVPALANAATEGSAPPALFGGFSIKGAASSAAPPAPAPAPAPTPSEPPKRRNGGFFGPSANASSANASSALASTESPTTAIPPRRNGGFFGPSANASSAATTSAIPEQPKTGSLFSGAGTLGSGPTFGTRMNAATGSSGATRPATGGFSGFATGATGAPKFTGFGAPTFGSAALAAKGGDKPAFSGFAGLNGPPSSSGTTFKFPTSNSNPTALISGELKPEGWAAPAPLSGFGSAKPGGLFAASTAPATGGGIPSTFGPFSFAGAQKPSES